MLRQEHTDWSDPYSIYNIQVDTVFTIRLAWGKKKISEVEVSPQTTSKKRETQSSTNNGIPPEGTALHGFLHNQKHTQSQMCSSHQLPHFLDISSSCNTLLYSASGPRAAPLYYSCKYISSTSAHFLFKPSSCNTLLYSVSGTYKQPPSIISLR